MDDVTCWLVQQMLLSTTFGRGARGANEVRRSLCVVAERMTSVCWSRGCLLTLLRPFLLQHDIEFEHRVAYVAACTESSLMEDIEAVRPWFIPSAASSPCDAAPLVPVTLRFEDGSTCTIACSLLLEARDLRRRLGVRAMGETDALVAAKLTVFVFVYVCVCVPGHETRDGWTRTA